MIQERVQNLMSGQAGIQEVLEAFRDVITSLLRKRNRTIRRVVFSNNTEGNFNLNKNSTKLFGVAWMRSWALRNVSRSF